MTETDDVWATPPTRRLTIIGDMMLTTIQDEVVEERERVAGAGIIAARAGALGARATLLSVIGHDIAGEHLRTALLDRGVSVGGLIPHPYVSTPHTLRAQVAGKAVARRDDGGSCHYPAQSQHWLTAALTAALARSDGLIIADYGFGLLSGAAVATLADALTRRPRPTVVLARDPRPYRALRPSVVIIGHEDASRTLRYHGAVITRAIDAAAPAIARATLELSGARAVVVCRGAAGLDLAYAPGVSDHQPATSLRAEDFAARLALSLMRGMAPALAITTALIATAAEERMPVGALANHVPHGWPESYEFDERDALADVAAAPFPQAGVQSEELTSHG